MYEAVRKDLYQLQDPKYQKFHSGIVPNIDNIIGVRIPDLRKYAKKVIVSYGKEYLKEIQTSSYEEVTLYGLVLTQLHLPYDEMLPYLEILIHHIDNWATCDIVASSLRLKKEEKERFFRDLLPYYESDEEFVRRFAVVCLFVYLDPFHLDEVTRRLTTVAHEEYYVSMAVAWVFSTIGMKYPEWFLSHLEEWKLDSATYLRTIQKVIDSRRVDIKWKEQLKEKRKWGRINPDS